MTSNKENDKHAPASRVDPLVRRCGWMYGKGSECGSLKVTHQIVYLGKGHQELFYCLDHARLMRENGGSVRLLGGRERNVIAK